MTRKANKDEESQGQRGGDFIAYYDISLLSKSLCHLQNHASVVQCRWIACCLAYHDTNNNFLCILWRGKYTLLAFHFPHEKSNSS